MYFKRKELEKFRSFKGPLIDVRSPSEYYKGHLPNSINIPLFDNDERSIIGTIYKKEGRKKAVIEGLKFFEKKMNLNKKIINSLTGNVIVFYNLIYFYLIKDLYFFTSGLIISVFINIIVYSIIYSILSKKLNTASSSNN